MKIRTGVKAQSDQGWAAGLGIEFSQSAGSHTRASLRPAGFGWRDLLQAAKQCAGITVICLLAYGICFLAGCM